MTEPKAEAAHREPSYDAIRKAITDSYYDSRNEGKTMEDAATLAATRVTNLMSQREAAHRDSLLRSAQKCHPCPGWGCIECEDGQVARDHA